MKKTKTPHKIEETRAGKQIRENCQFKTTLLDGSEVQGPIESINIFIDIDKEDKRKRVEWISFLRKYNIKAAHQDDGWNDRVNNVVKFSYPHFDDGVKVGDKIALGDYENFVIVQTTKVKKWFMQKTQCHYKSTIH